MEVVIASSSLDAGIGCWDLRTGAEKLRYRSCASAPQGLVSVAGRFLAASQLRGASSAASHPIFFWSWDKPHAEVKSFPPEPIGPLLSNSEGTYLMGGGLSGNIYLWEVASGKLLIKWSAHDQSVTCLTLSDDESMLISGGGDGRVRVWCLMKMFDDFSSEALDYRHVNSFYGHTLRVTSIVSGHGSCNSIVISASRDRTCKVWSLSEDRLLRSITFPSVINVIVLDPGEHVFYAGGSDGNIYIAALHAESKPDSIYGTFVVGALSDKRGEITCLAMSIDGITLVSGCEDGTVQVWDTKSKQVIRVLKHANGPVNNVVIVRHQLLSSAMSSQVSLSRKRNFLLPPPLGKYIDSTNGDAETKAVTLLQPSCHDLEDCIYYSSVLMMKQIKELEQQNSSGAAEVELERLSIEHKRSMQMVQQWKKLYRDLQSLCANEVLNGT